MWSATTRLKALDIREERLLAGRVAGLMYLIAALTALVLLYLPGVETSHWKAVALLAAIAGAWALVCLLVIEWDRIPPLVSHFSCSMGFPLIVATVAATGGANSPARFYLLFILVYVAYFYSPREAIPYIVGCLVVEAIPLLYDSSAIDDGLVAEIVVLGPTFAILGGLILAGKQLFVDLRDGERELSLRDPLTNLPNRRALMSLLDVHLRSAAGGDQRAEDSLGLVLVDLDHFKEVNTVHGYLAGDHVLCAASEALLTAARQGDMVARLGGDEFAIACPGMNDETLESLSRRVLEALAERNTELDLPGFVLTGSVGSALFPRDAATFQDLIAAADQCMRTAKATGRNRAVTSLAAA